MSLRERAVAQDAPQKKKFFGVVAGQRLAGKTTLAGTLPGRTLLLQAMIRESGCGSALKLASDNGNQLDVLNFKSVDELLGYLAEAKTDEDYDNIYVDGISAITDLKYHEPKIRALVKTDNWTAFREIGDVATAVILALKGLTYPENAKKPKNTFLTVALKHKLDKAGNVIDVDLEAKGNVAPTSITQFGEAVLTVLPPMRTESGETAHRLLTKSEGIWPARVDGVLAKDNPGFFEPADLRKVLELVGAC